jgi:ribosomal protein L12E/L44/L45/RPP1/RPP2
MLIANPIYDTAFKRLLENERVARFFISTLLGKPVLSIVPGSQEFTWQKTSPPKKKKNIQDAKPPKPTAEEKARAKGREFFTVYRLDYVATIDMGNGEQKRVIIEMQKAKHEEDLARFRAYLGENYKRVEKASGRSVMLPIIAIYVLGFNLPEIKTPCFRVNRTYEDLLTHKAINKKSPFVERLTHDGYFVQVQRISGKPRTKLDELLSLFEQKNFEVDDETAKFYRYQLSDPDVEEMAKMLQYMCADPELRAQMEAEAEDDRTRNEWLENQERRDAERANKLAVELDAEKQKSAEKDQALSAKDAALSVKDARIAELERLLAKNRGR